jgi:hypothetical protein
MNALCDKNDDGDVTLDELAEVGQGLIDKNNDGKITWHECAQFSFVGGIVLAYLTFLIGGFARKWRPYRMALKEQRESKRQELPEADRVLRLKVDNKAQSFLFAVDAGKKDVEFRDITDPPEWVKDRDGTLRFREALLLYANNLWVNEHALDTSYTDAHEHVTLLSLRMLSTRPKVKPDSDGRSVKQEPYQPLLIPLAPAGAGTGSFYETELPNKLPSTKSGGGRRIDGDDGRTEVLPLAPGFWPLCEPPKDGEDGRWEIQLRISFTDEDANQWETDQAEHTARVAGRRLANEAAAARSEQQRARAGEEQQQEEAEQPYAVPRADDVPAPPLPPGTLYVDIYGKNHRDRLEKAKTLVNTVFKWYFNAFEGSTETDESQINWYHLERVESIIHQTGPKQKKTTEIKLIWDVKSLGGTAEENAKYHQVPASDTGREGTHARIV